MSGMFITLEGIEGVGKSTLQKQLADALTQQDFNVLLTREPGGTKLGEKLRQAILSPDHEAVLPVTELLVMFAVRAQHVADVIKPALAQNKIVICDRFSDTSRAYQGAGRGLPMEWIEDLVQMTHPDVQPDLTFWLDLPADQALARAKSRALDADRIEQEKISFFENARVCYQKLALAEPNRVIRLDANLSPEALTAEGLKIIKEKML